MQANPFIQHPDLIPNPLTTEPPVGLQGPGEVKAPAPEVEQREANPPDPSDIATQKYGDDAAKIKQGYNEQFRETQRIMQQFQLAQDQNRILMEKLMAGGQPAQAVRAPEDELAELGLPTGAIQKLIDAGVEKRLAPLARMAQAQTEIMGEIPDFPTVAPKLQAFLRDNPQLQQEYSELAQTNPRVATKYIWREYQAQLPPPRVSAADSGLNRVNAAIPTTNSQGARLSTERDFGAELQNAKAYAEQTGDDRPYWKIWHEMSSGGAPMHPSFGVG